MKESEIKNLMNFKERLLGLEFENPIIDSNFQPVTFSFMQNVWQDFGKLGWKISEDPVLKVISGLDKDFGSGNVNLSSDSAAGNLEMALPPMNNLIEAEKLLRQVQGEVFKVLKKNKLLLLGIGLQPGDLSGLEKKRTKNTVYFAFKAMGAYDHYDNAIMTANSAHQAGISIRPEEVIDVTNELIKVTGLIIALCANSPVHNWKLLSYQEWRMLAWDLRFIGIKPGFQKLAGFPKRPFKSLADYFKYYWDLPFMVLPPLREGIWCVPEKKVNWFKYLNGKNFRSINLLGKRIELLPSVADINLAMISMWPHAKPHLILDPGKTTVKEFMGHFVTDSLENYLKDKLANCYLEYRGASASPPREEMSIPALIMGLVNNIGKVKEFTRAYSWQEWKDLAYKTSVKGMQAKMRKKDIFGLLDKLLNIAEEGLSKRKMKEKKYLKILQERLANRENPVDKARKGFAKNREEFLKIISYKI